jgi:hypothetical protein
MPVKSKHRKLTSFTNCLLGTREANYYATSPKLPKYRRSCILKKAFISSRKLITGNPFAIGFKDTHISRGIYVLKLKWIYQRYMVLWDEDTKQGWLINSTSALLHILRASLKYNSTNKFKSAFLFQGEEMQEASELYTTKSAIKVLLSTVNKRLKIYPEKDNYIRLKHRVEHFYNILEQIVDYQYHRLSTVRENNMKITYTPQGYLEGWNFEHLACGKDPIYPYVARLRAYRKS